MKNNTFQEIGITGGLIILAVLLLNPFGFWMPDMVVIAMLCVLFVLVGIFASFILREKVGDEREGVHRMLAGRNAFLSGSLVLTVAIAFQSFSHQVDPWIVIALVVMIIVKIGTRLWSDSNM